MEKLMFIVFSFGFAGTLLGCFNMLSDDGRWVVVGIFALFLLLATIWKAKRKGIIPLAITIAVILTTQSSSKAQTFEELEVLSSTNTSILQLLTPGNFGPISLYEDEGSMGQWVQVEAPGFYFSSNKEMWIGVQGTTVKSPTILGGKINENLYILLIRTYTPGSISEENKLYFIDNNSSQELFIPGRIVKVFEKDGILFIDSQVGGYRSQTYTQIYTILSLRGETIISTAYQREVLIRIEK